MDSAVAAALARAHPLTPAQLRGVITLVADLHPGQLTTLATRPDLTPDLREHLLTAAPPAVVMAVLTTGAIDPGLIRTVAAAHGPLPELITLCGARDWLDLATELAAQLDWRTVFSVERRWSAEVGELPDAVRVALTQAALTERDPAPSTATLSEREKHELRRRQRQEREARLDTAWQLIADHPRLWPGLTHHADLRALLQARASELPDAVLLACLPEVTAHDLREDDRDLAELRLDIAARHVGRHPRLREIAADELRELVREVLATGWTPGGHDEPEWRGLGALAELSTDTEVLTTALATLRDAAPSPYHSRDRDLLHHWHRRRAQALATLAANPAVPRADLLAVLPGLDDTALTALHDHSDGDLRAACAHRLAQLRQAAADKSPHLVPVPADEELSTHPDPAATLRAQLPLLRGRAAQREATTEGLLRSRFTTPEILRALPAVRVLAAPEQAELVASMVAAACGEDQRRWQALRARCAPPPPRTLRFGALLDELATGS